MSFRVSLAAADHRTAGTYQPVRYAKQTHWGKPGATWTVCHRNPWGRRAVKRNQAAQGATVTCRRCLAYLTTYPNLSWLAAAVAEGRGRSGRGEPRG